MLSDEIEPYSKHPSELRPYEVCPPPAEGRVGCLAVGAPNPDKLRAAGQPTPNYEGSGVAGGFSPEDLRSAYGLSSEEGEGKTVAITIAFDDPTAEEDLAAYRKNYGLPECTSKSGCFRKLNQKGEEKNYPVADFGWTLEASLDLDMVSAVCPKCHIVLIEANDNYYENLEPAVEKAAELSPDAISNSWGSEEFSNEVSENHYFNHPGIPVLFASGDFGYGVEYPSSSPDVISVGGTSLLKAKETTRGWAESAWSGAGSGCSAYQEKPTWQKDEGCAKRTVADVSAVADPGTPVSVRAASGWWLVGGTSAATPILAGVEAVSSAAFRAAGPAAFVRAGQGGELFDPTKGRNGACGNYLCEAEVGYDGPTGWGTPSGPLSLPVAITEAATVGSSTEATLHGMVDPRGLATEYRFEYGETTSYGTNVPVPDKSIGSGNGYVEASQTLKSLKGKTTYHYRLTAVNSAGTFHGNDRTFGTTPPAATTETATEIHANDAALTGTVNPEGLETSFYFEYGASSSYGHRIHAETESIGSGTAPVTVKAIAAVLTGNTTYHFRVVATSPAGTSHGKDETFTTSPANWLAKPIAKPPKAPRPHTYPYSNALSSVSCVSQSYCMAVGNYFSYFNQMDSHLWNGKEWTTSPMAIPAEGHDPGSAEVIVRDVSCSSKTWCVAVGYYFVAGAEGWRPLFQEWNGSGWTVDPVTRPAPDAYLSAVSCTSSSGCMATGYAEPGNGSPPYMVPLIYRWNGKEWSKLTPAPMKYPEEDWFTPWDVSCATATWCMAVGEHYYLAGGYRSSYQPLAEVWDGEQWSIVKSASPNPAKEGIAIRSVSCSAVEQCGLLTYDVSKDISREGIPWAEHWNGTEWIRDEMPQPVGTTFTEPAAISCVSANACRAVGYSIASQGGAVPAAFGWNGTNWSTESVSVPTQEADLGVPLDFMEAVSCISANYCVGAGGYYTEAKEWNGMAEVMQSRPTAITEPASNLGGPSPTMNGSVNPNGAETKYYFEYGTSLAYGSKTGEVSAGAGTTSIKVSKPLHTLEANVIYHYRLVATNSGGITKGADREISTSDWATRLSSNEGDKANYFSGEPSCSSTVACEATGSYETVSGSRPLAERWDGMQWVSQSVPIPSGAKEASLTTTSCATSTSCTAAGNYTNSAGTIVTLAEQWNGSQWSVQTTPNPEGATDSRLTSVSCPTSSTCTATGYYHTGSGIWEALAERWDGTKWVLQPMPNPSGAKETKPEGVSCLSASNCEASGSYQNSSGARLSLTEVWNGTSWEVQSSPNPTGAKEAKLFGLSCISSAKCEAVGFYESSSGTHAAFAEIWNGTNWELQSVPELEGAKATHLYGVSCASSTVCEATGYYQTSSNENVPVAVRWNGTAWSAQTVPKPEGAENAILGGVSCSSASSCAATGYFVNSSGSVRTLADSLGGVAPFVATQSATALKGTRVTLNGQVGPNGAPTEYFFEYGATTSYGSTTVAAGVDEDAELLQESKAITGLEPNRTYHFRIVASNAVGTSRGEDKTVTTPEPLPEAITEAATSVTPTKATLNGTVYPEGLTTTYYFEYGKTTSYGTKIPTSAASVGSGTANVAVSQGLTGLGEATTYHYRVTATNSSGTVHGADHTFATENGAFSTWRDTGTRLGLRGQGVQTLLEGTLTPELYGGNVKLGPCEVEAVAELWNDDGALGALTVTELAPCEGEAFSSHCEITEGESNQDWGLVFYEAGEAEVSIPGFSQHVEGCGSLKEIVYHGEIGGEWNNETQCLSFESGELQSNIGGAVLSGELCAPGQSLTVTSNAPIWRIAATEKVEVAENTPTWESLDDVSCVSARACMAVGTAEVEGEEFYIQPIAEHWNGMGWSAAPMQNHGGHEDWIRSVSCAGPKSCLAVGVSWAGETRTLLAESWDGEKWALLSMPAINGQLTSVSCITTSNCFAVGNKYASGKDHTLVMHWDGKEWASVSSPDPTSYSYSVELTDVSCPSSSSCEAIGGYTTGSGYEGIALAYDGEKWSIGPNPGGGGELTRISCTEEGNAPECTAISWNSVARFDGSKWAAQTGPKVSSNFSDVSCATASSCTIVGGGAAPVAFQWEGNGSSWVDSDAANPAAIEGSGASGGFLFGVSCPDTRRCVAVGTEEMTTSEPNAVLAEIYE